MNTQTSFPPETTCGYPNAPVQNLPYLENYDLTHQIGSLLIALGSLVGSAPLLRLHINPGTARLLISIGRKLVRAAGKTTQAYC
jgi:hypothetical protein